ncbi:MAG: Polyribonucleotide nucleotidyltransferase, partial [Parcubacteria group bacterium GW2011_GWA2_47_8]
MKFHTFETKVGETPFKVEINKVAMQAGGSVLATFGKTTVLATATMSNHPRQGATFFPLTVDFD